MDENGAVLLTYSYTAWGKVSFTATDMDSLILAGTLSNVNPFTYRGYCYDYDIGMYYLQSRYYDPEICRFINADSTDYLGATGTLLSYNLFAYCENDGVNFVDETGFTYIYSGYVPWTEPNDDQYFYNKNEKVKISDKLNWGVWGGAKSVAKLLYPDGAKFYEHFRSNTGRILYYDYTKAYKEDALIKANVDSLIKLIKTWACLFKGKKMSIIICHQI